MRLDSGDAAHIRAVYDEIRALTPMYTLWGHAHWDRLRALLAHRIGNGEEEGCLRAAADFCRRAGYDPELARICVQWAEWLVERGETDRAAALIAQGRGLVARLGMTGLESRLNALARRAHAAEAPPEGLTEREVEVIRLVAQGLANKEIADRLNISYHTAVNHVRNIFEKTGVHSRTELIRRAELLGLLP
jgi:DNA-binding CsgD family transcriptional regulator